MAERAPLQDTGHINLITSQRLHVSDIYCRELLLHLYKATKAMSLRETIIRHSLIINRLRQRPHTWDEIDGFLRRESEIQEYKLYVSQRTFQRDIADILSVHGVEIINDRSKKQYRICSTDENDQRYLEAFDVFSLLKMGGNRTADVSFEKRRPQGTEHLYGLLHAIRNRLQIIFQYHKYYESRSETRKVEPHALKEAKNRWYLICKDIDRNELRVFALDRLANLEITKKRFNLTKALDVEQLFRPCFGVMLPNGERQVEEIVLSFNSFQGKYIKSLPLHSSQEVLIDNEQELRIKLRMYVTYDFIMELLSHGNAVKVLQPDLLVNEIKQHYQSAIEQY